MLFEAESVSINRTFTSSTISFEWKIRKVFPPLNHPRHPLAELFEDKVLCFWHVYDNVDDDARESYVEKTKHFRFLVFFLAFQRLPRVCLAWK